MKKLTPRRLIWQTAQKVVLGEVLPNKDLAKKIAEIEERMHKQWYDSNETDFSFYSEQDYLTLLFGSWDVRSAQDTDFLIKNDLFKNPKTIFDFHGGLGFTAMRLAMQFPDATVYSHSVVEEHRKSCEKISKELGLTNVIATDKLQKADLLIAQETMEHIKDPFAEMNMLLDTVKPEQYLDGTSFTIDSPGHFTTYLNGTASIPKNSAKRHLFNVLRSRGYEVYWKVRVGHKQPFNCRPALFDKK